MIQLHIISALAQGEVVAAIGQINDPTRKQLEKMVRHGDIAKWRGKWFPVAGAPFGIGQDKTCYGPVGSQDRWAGFKL